jgi:hypothetical protein
MKKVLISLFVVTFFIVAVGLIVAADKSKV